ncbi:hypothetical protein ASD24_24670 [Paenibacillus sp. Root52]|uniref:hypothetical protein n=1 Tax=Paenibacillus sp. Root52 TaxID=1736552 RepID=UPI0006FFAB92|nr:hypothetical protein [Paenibacillus sp. Root52]KQY90993.1 hypothetical protein ASD24_24670 [Paenibacillus sp. Root52]
MIGQYGNNTNDRRYRDLAEYITMRMLTQVMPDLKKQGITVTASIMQRFRDRWEQNGTPINFTTMKVKPSDVARLLRSTGASSFGEIDDNDKLEVGITEFWKKCVVEYDQAAAQGNYLHVITDPEIRQYVLQNGDSPMSKAFFVSKGKSLREMNSGDAVTLYDRIDVTYRYTSRITIGVAPERAGSNQAAIVQPGQQSNRRQPSESTNVAYPEDRNENGQVLSDENLLGWNGGVIENREYRGLRHVMGAYLSKVDAESVAKNFDSGKLFDAEFAHNGAELLKHMRSSGYDFSVRDNGNRNQIEVRMTVGDRITVRVFDEEANGNYIGRIYDASNAYYFNVKGSRDVKSATKFTAEDSIALLDYVTGNKTGRVTKSVSTDSSSVQIKGIDSKKSLQVKPIPGRYRSLVFGSEVEAKEYIETAINDAQRSINNQFKADEIQGLIDKSLDNDELLITGPEFQGELETIYSADDMIREAQERAAMLAYHSQDGGREYLDRVQNELVGNYEDGFNPEVVMNHMMQTGRGNERDAMMSALKTVKYDITKIKGNDFAVGATRDRLIEFNAETAKTIHEIEDPMLKQALQTVHDTLNDGGVYGDRGFGFDPVVKIDENGIIHWEGIRRTGSAKEAQRWQNISGDIGQVFVPNEHGIIETKFQGGNNYGIVPGYTGYFSFEGDYDDRMSRFRVKGFERHLTEQLRAQVTHQLTRPFDRTISNIPTTLDASSINGLYHGDVYGKRVELDFIEVNQLNMETKEAILKTLSNRVRFDNQFSDFATTSAETQANRDLGAGDDSAAFSYWKVAGETNMRVLSQDLDNYADTTMTGTGKTQGLIWYLVDGAEVKSDGSVIPSQGIELEDGQVIPDKTALQKLSYFDNKAHNAWDRNQMSSNQLMTALKVDEGVGTALMSFGGWTFNDSYAVSKEFAVRNKIFGNDSNDVSMDVLKETIAHVADGGDKFEVLNGTGMMWSDEVLAEGVRAWRAGLDEDVSLDFFLEQHGRFRPLQRGDKLSDFGGNKGTIGIIIDRHMSDEEAKAQKLDKEVRFLRANPDLDVVSAPYSMLSRHNAGVVKELMSGEVKDLVDPDTGEVFKGAMGRLNIIVTDMKVDDKTHAYTREDVLSGKGRKASGQLAWALESKNATGILNEIYGRNDAAWSTYREYLIATGLDMKADGTILNGYQPHAAEERNHFKFDSTMDASNFLDQIKSQGGFLDVPFEVHFQTGQSSSEIPVLSASLRQNVELIDGSMRRSDFTNYYANIYEAVGEYEQSVDDEGRRKAQSKAQEQFDKIQTTIIDRQFNGGHNGKHSFIRDKIMGKKQSNSATAVAIVDPRLKIGEGAMNQKMMDSLNVKEGEMVMGWRDPVWRDGAIRTYKVVKDDSVHGIAINPVADKSHDMDHDGDTMGLVKFETAAANRDLVEKFSHWSNMIDKGNGKNQLYFQTGMDLASAEARAFKLGDTSVIELYERAEKNAKSSHSKVLQQSLRDLSAYSHKCFREHGFGGDYVSLTDDESVHRSFEQMVNNGAKGNAKKLEDYMDYHMGVKTDHDAREIQYATGVKSDDTGLAGAFSQKLVAIMRNENITAALESMYPLTQGTLQIKHDAEHARTVNEILTDDMNKTFRGKDVDNPKRSLTPSTFKAQLTNIMENKMKVDVNEEYIQAVTDTLTYQGQIIPLKEAMAIKGSPMDRVAYGGGYDELRRLAMKEESLLEGEQNKLFAPFSMRNADEQTKLAKKDTQRMVKPAMNTPVNQLETHHEDVEEMGMSL